MRTIRELRQLMRRDEGAATAEYAITIMAAVGFAGLLVAILRSSEVQGILTDLVHRALTVAG
jgi:Flp pilus assembly pilin Flp